MGTVTVVNMIPRSLSGEHSQDSEPNIAVNPQNMREIVGTAFTASPVGGTFAPIYVTTDGGMTWSLRNVVPGNGSFGTGDITVGFSSTDGVLYAGTLNGSTGRLNILRTTSFTSMTPMDVLVDRASEDQPWVIAGTVVVSGTPRDRVFVGNNNFGQPAGQTATVDVSQSARTAAAPAGFAARRIERRTTSGQDGPPIRLALHPDGTVYAAFHRWVTRSGSDVDLDIVMCRDDAWGAGTNPFDDLIDAGDGLVGQRVATGRFIRFNAVMGQERLGADLAVAVDPNNSSSVWVAWCDRVGGATGTDWTIHLRHSTDRGQTWSADLRTVTNAKNPSVAVSDRGVVGFLFQAFTGTRWVTQFETTADAFATAPAATVLHTAPSTTPARQFFPYIGDYVRVLSVGADFYGVFSANNTPDAANFPNSVVYQRNADWVTRTLLDVDNTTVVDPSIDPFFFHWTDDPSVIGPISRIPITRTPIITRTPVIGRTPINRTPIITPEPINRTPIVTREPVVGPIAPEPIIGPNPPVNPRRRRGGGQRALAADDIARVADQALGAGDDPHRIDL
jgi:hypothetical protein